MAEPSLSRRELLVAQLFADGHSATEIGTSLGLSSETVRAYLRSVRGKYSAVGRNASDKIQLRSRLFEDGRLGEK